MQTELFSVSKLFTEHLLRIPDYQRGYAWRERHLKDFWSDLEQLEPGRYHYTGVLTLEEVPQEKLAHWHEDNWIVESKSYKPYYVVDGQQRLTTIVILLQCLVERIGDDQKLNYSTGRDIRTKYIYESKDDGISRSYIFGYEKDNPSYEFLKRVILLDRSDNHSVGEETIYTQNLERAKEFFSEKISKLDIHELELLFAKVTQRLLFNFYTISQHMDVFVVFETLNNRGKPLSNLELLKNRLIFLSTKFDAAPDDKRTLRHTINESWKTLYHYLGKNKDRPLDDDLFLNMHHWLFYSPPSRVPEEENQRRVYWRARDDEYKDDLLENVFTVRNLKPAPDEKPFVTLSIEYLYNYSHDIKEAVEKWYQICNPHDSAFTDDERIWLERLRRIADPDDKLLLLALYRTKSDVRDRIECLKLLERILFLHGITSYYPGLDPLRQDQLAAKIALGKCNVRDVISEYEGFLRAALKVVKFPQAIREWSKREGGYRWDSIRYFMFEYEQKLLSMSKTDRQKLIWEEFARERFDTDYITVEHILPQR
jgi:hypothetical protein